MGKDGGKEDGATKAKAKALTFTRKGVDVMWYQIGENRKSRDADGRTDNGDEKDEDEDEGPRRQRRYSCCRSYDPDIVDYVKSVVHSDSKMCRWRDEDKDMV